MTRTRTYIGYSQTVGAYLNGKKTGPQWLQKEGNAFLVVSVTDGKYGEVAEGAGVYIYPNGDLAIEGEFAAGKMTGGRYVSVDRDEDMEAGPFGIPVPRTRTLDCESDSALFHDPSTWMRISRNPLAQVIDSTYNRLINSVVNTTFVFRIGTMRSRSTSVPRSYLPRPARACLRGGTSAREISSVFSTASGSARLAGRRWP